VGDKYHSTTANITEVHITEKHPALKVPFFQQYMVWNTVSHYQVPGNYYCFIKDKKNSVCNNTRKINDITVAIMEYVNISTAVRHVNKATTIYSTKC
jgi:hypothetical protein